MGFIEEPLYYCGIHFTKCAERSRITETGKDLTPDQVKAFTTAIDLKSKQVLAGLIDRRIHFIDGGLELLQLSFFDVADRQGLINKIKGGFLATSQKSQHTTFPANRNANAIAN